MKGRSKEELAVSAFHSEWRDWATGVTKTGKGIFECLKYFKDA